MGIEFRRQTVESQILNPFKDFARETVPVETRWDPLLGYGSRLIQRPLRPTARPDLSRVIERTSNCHFCAENVERLTPRLLPELSAEPRLRSGRAVLFPNIAAYAKYSAVSIFSTDHFISLDGLSAALVADVLRLNQRYARLVFAHDPEARHCYVCSNYLPSSGGSMIHPHVQISLDPVPSTIPRLVGEAGLAYWQREGRSYWNDLITCEQAAGERYVGRIGGGEWLAAFAPLGFDEVLAVLPERSTLLDLTERDVDDLANGISQVLRYYGDTDHNSYNLAIYSAPLDAPAAHFPLHLRLITRSNYEAYYRSDATYWERLHWEALVSTTPEQTAAALRAYFDPQAGH